MTKDGLIDEHVSLQQSKLAVDALLSHAAKVQEKKAESELLPGKEQNVWLMIAVKQMQPEKKLKPFKIPIAHPIVDPRVSSVCLITKDPQREYKDLLESHGIRFISRVVGVEKLKGKFKPFEARRMLLKENDLFLADERVVPLLPGLLGSKFFEAKKQPIPVCLTRKDLKGELERAISSTYFHQNKGTCTSVKIGTVSQPSSKVLDNLKMALPAIVKRIKGEWDNIQSFHIKTNSSASLPIWNCDLGAAEGARWDGLVAQSGSEEESEAEESEDGSEVGADGAVSAKDISKKVTGSAPTPKAKSKKGQAEPMEVDALVPPSKEHGKGKKRAAEDIDNNTPQKKAKADPASSSATKAGPKKMVRDAPTTNLPKAPVVAPISVDTSAQGKKRRSSVSHAEVLAPVHTLSAPTNDSKAAEDGADTVAPSKNPTSETPVIASPTTPLAHVSAAAGPTKRRKRAKMAAVDASKETDSAATAPVTEPIEPTAPSQPTANVGEAAAPSKPRKRKHAKAAAQAVTTEGDAEASAKADVAEMPSQRHHAVAENTDGATKKKRKKAKAVEAEAEQPSLAVAAPSATPTPAQGEQASAGGAPPEPATPVTSSVARRRRKRASAVEFFEDGKSTEIPAAPFASVPPNTPAAGPTASTPSSAAKNKGKVVDATPLKSALEKVASEPLDASPARVNAVAQDAEGARESPAKKPRKRKAKATLSAAPASMDVPAAAPTAEAASSAAAVTTDADGDTAQPKKVKRKHRRAASEAAALADATASPLASTLQSTVPTKEELKKKRGAARSEKKKEKALGAVPAAKSAKDAVVGKKHH